MIALALFFLYLIIPRLKNPSRCFNRILYHSSKSLNIYQDIQFTRQLLKWYTKEKKGIGLIFRGAVIMTILNTTRDTAAMYSADREEHGYE